MIIKVTVATARGPKDKLIDLSKGQAFLDIITDSSMSMVRVYIDAVGLEVVEYERSKYRHALEKIRNLDYRGNRHISASIAAKAMESDLT